MFLLGKEKLRQCHKHPPVLSQEMWKCLYDFLHDLKLKTLDQKGALTTTGYTNWKRA